MEGELYNVQEGLEGELGYKGERGYSAYEIAVLHGFEGSEQDWIDHFGLDLTDYIKTSDVIDNLTSTSTNYPLSANQGKELKTLVDGLDTSKADASSVYTKSEVYTKDETYNKSQIDGTEHDFDVRCGNIESSLTDATNLINYYKPVALTYTYTQGGTQDMSYPSGFAYNNCVVTSVMWRASGTSVWHDIPSTWEEGVYVRLTSDVIRTTYSMSGTGTVYVRITLQHI